MSDEEDSISDQDVEYHSTQREIEDLRKKEEELMSKMNALANKRKSCSENSLDDEEDETKEHETEEHEEIGQRRRPSSTSSRGSSKSLEKLNDRPRSLNLSSDPDNFKSRASVSSGTSPGKDSRISSAKSSKASSKSSSRTSLTSPGKEPARNTRSKISVTQSRGSRSSSTSPAKSGVSTRSDHSYRISVRSSSGELASSPTKREPPRSVSPTKNRRSETKQENRTKMNRSYSTPDGMKKSPGGSQKTVRRSSDDIKVTKSSVKRRSFPVAEDVLSDQEEENKSRGKKASSTSNLTSVDVPENKLSDRGTRGSRSSSRDGRSRNSVNINDDSYEIIEMEDEADESSPHDKLTAREKIEQELAEQIQREEELRQAHGVVKSADDGESEAEGGPVEEEDAEEDGKDSSDEDQKSEEPKLSTWEKIALEIEEEKKREEEVKQRAVKQEEESGDSGEGEEEEAGIEIEEEHGNQTLDVSTKINLEIEEQIRREEELRSASRAGGEGIEEDIEHDSGEDSPEEEQEKVVSVQDRIEMEIKEIEKREKELRKTYQAEVVVEEIEADEGIEEVESEPVQDEARSKIQQEIDEFKQKESEIRRLHGINDSDESGEDSGGEGKFAGLTVIERELKEQKIREREYRKQHMREQIPDNGDEEEEEAEGADGAVEDKNADDDDYEDDEIPEDESMLIELENTKKAAKSIRNKGTRNTGERNREGGKSNEDFSVTPGIARRFIHMFDKGEVAKTPKKDESRESLMKNKKAKLNGQANRSKDYKDDFIEDDYEASSDEDGTQGKSKAARRITSDEEERQGDDDQRSNKDQHGGIHAPSPGKRLVLRRKKSKKREDEHDDDLEVVEKALASIGKMNAADKTKERKPTKKAHPLAQHWEKIQEQKKEEAIKNDIQATRKQKEEEKRKQKEDEEQREKEKALQKTGLQGRRTKLAEEWESKSNNNYMKENSTSTEITPKKESLNAKSPKKSLTAKKETRASKKSPGTPKSAKMNIMMWEQRIQSSTTK